MKRAVRVEANAIDLAHNSEVMLNFETCIICQTIREQMKLENPTQQGYISLCRDLASFLEWRKDKLPIHIIKTFQNAKYFGDLLKKHKAVYHKQCRNNFDTRTLNRLMNKHSSAINEQSSSDALQNLCIFCKTLDPKLEMSTVTLPDTLPKIINQATLNMNHELVAELTGKQAVNSPIKYHKKCNIAFFKENLSAPVTEEQPEKFEDSYDLVLAEIIDQIEDGRKSSAHDFYQLSQLTKGMVERLSELGLENCTIHSTRLKDQLLASIPGLRCDKVGRQIYLFFDEDVKHILEKVIENPEDDEDMILEKAVDIIKRTLYPENPIVFSGSFNGNFCAENTVSKKLVTFLSLLTGNGESKSKIPENIAQIIQFNCVKRRKSGVQYVRHNVEREQPLTVYLGLLVHSLSGKRELVDEIFKLGLSISYSRVLEIERTVAAKICEMYRQNDCVCPPNLSNGLFTTAAIDNIDHNPKSTSANYSFHGTGISLIQHYNQRSNNDSKESVFLTKTDFANKSRAFLSPSYYNVPYVPSIDGELPVSTVNWKVDFPTKNPLEYTKNWLQNSTKLMNENSYDDLISWAAYNSRLSEDISSCKSTSAMLPLLKDNINSPSVIRHTMDIIIAATNKLNPSQIAVVTGDQPVYAIAKQIQWSYPEKYGEDKIVIMFGGLHIEKSFLAVIGTWLEGSGWEEALVKAGITTPGRSEGILKSSHIKKARYAHEVSLTALNITLFDTFKSETDLENSQYFEWIKKKSTTSPQFQYWITVMELEAILLQFIKCLRTGDFDFVDILEQMCPWYFVTNHTHYSRWMPVFVTDMKKLKEKHPEIYAEFKRGHFTSRQTNRKFSCISDDHLHEQNNKIVKGSCSLLGMLNDEASIATWMTSGPELTRLITEYRNLSSNNEDEDLGHHEDTNAFQTTFGKHVKDLVTTFKNKGPFCTTDLTSIGDERKVMNPKSVESVTIATELGLKKYREYLMDRLITTKLSIHQTISHCQLNLFKIKPIRAINEDKKKRADAMDSNLFLKLFIADQCRQGDASEFFKHENNRYPPSLSEFGKLRKPTTKDEILKCLFDPKSEHVTNGERINASAIIIHASSLVQNIPPTKTVTVKQYSEELFDEFIIKKFDMHKWVDIVFDVNEKNSFKELIREYGDEENYLSLIDNDTRMFSTKKWLEKLLLNANTKTQFMKQIAYNFTQNVAAQGNMKVHIAEDYVVISNEAITDSSSIFQLSLEESNARLLQHVQHAVRNGHKNILVSSVDSNVIVVALYAFKYLLPDIQKLWVEMKNGKYVSIHGLYEVHKDKSDLLLFFHTFTGDHFTSGFYGIGKKTAWNKWNKFRNLDSAILQLIENGSPELCDRSMKILEKFVILLYDPSSNFTSLQDCRRVLLMKDGIVEKIPPTRDALEQHVKRTLLQVNIWMQCLQNNNISFEVSDWGWVKDRYERYTPLWSTIPILTEYCQGLISCGCEEKCNRCKCVTSKLKCTVLCSCGGKCDYTKLIS